MSKLCQFHAVLLAQKALLVAPVFHVVYLNRLVARRRHEQLALVIVVNRQDMGRGTPITEVLSSKKLAPSQITRRV